MKKGDKKETSINLLDLIPVRNTDYEKNDAGLITLLKPKFKNPFLVKYILPKLKNPHYRIKFDEIGSFFWENCDGTRAVKALAELQYKKFGEKVEPLYDRLSLFLQNLEKNGLIVFKGVPKA